MTEGFLIGRVVLCFDAKEEVDVRKDLSAVALDADNNLWLASDETTAVERLHVQGRGLFGDHQVCDLAPLLDLPNPDPTKEIDIEGMDVEHDALWIIGSHTSTRKKPKGKSTRKDLERLTKVVRNLNRYLVARIPLSKGNLGTTAEHLPFTTHGNALTEALRTDPHLGPFLHIPGPEENSIQLATKENGFDIEGLAVRDDRVLLGLRGPVLRGWAALILEIEPKSSGGSELTLKPIGNEDRPYRKHFVNLGGMGVRDLCWSGSDLIILSGPTMDLTGLQSVWRLRDAADLDDDSLIDEGDKKLELLFHLPVLQGADKAEGIEVYEGHGEPGLLVVFDAPSDARLSEDGTTALADVYRLPSA